MKTKLHLPEREAREQDVIVQTLKTWLQTHHDWLLILDNADYNGSKNVRHEVACNE